MPGALTGLRVLDLSQVLAGPFCTMLLADHGAEVIKIEPPEGDPARRFPPFLPGDVDRPFGGYFQSINRGKKSVVLDLKKPQDRDAFLKLVAGADVLVENYRAGVMERFGLGYEALATVNPRLVYAAIRGFGDPRTGLSPYADWPAFDVVAQAMGGIMSITGPDPATPLKIGPGVGDTVPALMLAFGILAAVRHAERTGQGQFMDIAMNDAVLALCERLVQQTSYTGTAPHPEGNGHPLLCPFGLFRAADGWVALGCPTDRFWADLAALIGRPQLAADPAFATNAARVENRAAVTAAIEAFTARRTKAELTQRFGTKVPFGPVMDGADIAADPHYTAREMLVTVAHPGADAPVRIAGVPLKLTQTPGGVRSRAPLLGEHTDDVLTGLTSARQAP
jgi:crotonobetainyl-CoA:carnitine CoA-transferase CaiB-like acyl-CoA transferase